MLQNNVVDKNDDSPIEIAICQGKPNGRRIKVRIFSRFMSIFRRSFSDRKPFRYFSSMFPLLIWYLYTKP